MITNARIVCTEADYSEYSLELERGDPKLVVRVHTLTEVRRNARRWLNGYKSPASKSQEWGVMLDMLVLQPDRFKEKYAVPPASYTNKDGKVCKWRDDDRIETVRTWKQEHQGQTMLSEAHVEALRQAAGVIACDPPVLNLLSSGPSQVWVAADWTDKATGLTVPVKCLIDKVPAASDPVYGKCLADLKTTSNASPRRFARDCFDYHYATQAAFYMDLYIAATREDRTDFLHIIQENFAPYELRSPPPILASRWVDAGRWEYQQLMAYYCQCLKNDKWPGYDDDGDWPVTEPEDWMLREVLPKWSESESEEEAEPETAQDIIP